MEVLDKEKRRRKRYLRPLGLVLLLTDRARVLVLVEMVSLFQPAAAWVLLSTERRGM